MRAQTEILGFAMVVVLVSVGLLFIIVFMVSGQERDLRKDFVNKQLAVNMLDTVMSSTSTCRGLLYWQIASDCGGRREFICKEQLNYTSCDYLRDELGEMFALTFDQWQVDYRYKLFDASDPQIFLQLPDQSRCQGDIDVARYPISVSGKQIIASLEICS